MGASIPGFVVKKASLERGKAVLAVKRRMLKVRVGTFALLSSHVQMKLTRVFSVTLPQLLHSPDMVA